jgi:Plant transposon protein
MPRCVYEEIRTRILETDNFFQERSDALGMPGLSTDIKITAALRQLSLGVGADAVVEYCRVSESTASECLKRFCAAVSAALGKEYLRNPMAQELARIESEYAALGYPGCIGCVDCASWEWDNCPVALQGNHRGKGKKAECRVEVVCDDYLYIWHLLFGTPGSKNDINIMKASTLFSNIRAGKWPPCRPQIDVAGFPLSWFYYLADGIYHRFRIFAQTCSAEGAQGKAVLQVSRGRAKICRACVWGSFQAIWNFVHVGFWVFLGMKAASLFPTS